MNHSEPDEFGVAPEDEELDREAMTRSQADLRSAWQVFEDNFRAWMRLDEWANTGVNHLTLMASDSPPDQLFREPSRLLNNVLAAAGALIDHNRNHLDRAFSAHSFREEAQGEVDRLFKDAPMPVFVKELRNYSLHNRPFCTPQLSA